MKYRTCSAKLRAKSSRRVNFVGTFFGDSRNALLKSQCRSVLRSTGWVRQYQVHCPHSPGSPALHPPAPPTIRLTLIEHELARSRLGMLESIASRAIAAPVLRAPIVRVQPRSPARCGGGCANTLRRATKESSGDAQYFELPVIGSAARQRFRIWRSAASVRG